MAYFAIAFIAPNYRNYSNQWLKAYEPGTTTPKAMALDSAAVTTVAKLQLNADGFLKSAGGALVIPYIEGAYDLWLFPTSAEADANDTSSASRLADNVTGVNIAGISASVKAFDTLQSAKSSDDSSLIFNGAALNIAERTSGDGGGAMWDVHPAGAFTTSINVVDHDTLPFQLVNRLIKGETPAKPTKVKPSLSEFLSSSLLATDSEQIKIGDGRLSPGAAITDLVYRTGHNDEGGTYGSLAISARFATLQQDFTNPMNFTLQLEPTLLAGVTVEGIASDDPELPSAGLTTFPITDNGGGSYSFGPFVNSAPNKNYYGLQVKLTPVDATNDATLHDEYFVIKSMTMVTNGVDHLNQTEALGGSTWAQQVLRALPLAFSHQVLSSAAAVDVSITHSQNLSGASYRYAYISPDGLSTNEGGEFTGFDLQTGAGLFSSGSVSTLLLKSGTYNYAGVKPRDAFVISSSNQKLVCVGVDDAIIDASLPLLFSGMTSVSSHYEIAYNEVNNYNAATIGVGTTTPKIVLETLNYNFTEVATSAETDATDWSFFWDNSTKKFHIRFDGTQTDDVHVCEAGNLVLGDNIGYFGMARVKAKGFQGAVLNINAGEYYETYKTGTLAGNAAGNIYDIDDIDGIQVDDTLIKCQADGYNYHGTGHTDIFDCNANYCKDDGISHHDDCTGFIQGGNYDNNGKSGVIPGFGAYVTACNVSAAGNKLGTSPLSQEGLFGGFACVSNDTDAKETTLICYDCTADDNKYNFLSSGGKSGLVAYRGTSTSSVSADFAAITWGSNAEAGRIDTVQASGSIDFIVGQEYKVNVKV